MKRDSYNQKIHEFIDENNFTKLAKDNTKTQQKIIRETINTCNSLIKHSDKWKYINMNPEAPPILGTVKLHKENKAFLNTTVASAGKNIYCLHHLHVRHATGCTP
jgi:hypothetical protein